MKKTQYSESEASVTSNSQTIEGNLVIANVDDFVSNKSQIINYLQSDDGSLLKLDLNSNLNINAGSKIRLTGNKTSPETFTVNKSSTDADSLTILESGTISSNATGSVRIAMIFANYYETFETTPTPQVANNVFNNLVVPYYLENSFGLLTYSAISYGWYKLPQSDSCDVIDYVLEAIKQADIDINYNNFDQILVSLPSNSRCYGLKYASGLSFGGVYINTNEGNLMKPLTYVASHTITNDPRYKDNVSVIAHELGHALGYGHANGLECGSSSVLGICSSIELGDSWDLMGNGAFSHLGAYYKEKSGWIPASRILTITTSGRYQLGSIEQPTNFAQIIKIPLSVNDFYYVENRIKYGFDSTLPDNATNGALIKRGPNTVFPNDIHGDSFIIDATPNSIENDDFSDAGWGYGKTFYDPNHGIKITPISKTNNILTVDIAFSTPTIIFTPTPTTAPTPICTDSDGGDNIYLKGIIDGPNLANGDDPIDYCLNSSDLTEYSCSSEGGYTCFSYMDGLCAATKACADGCGNGACIKNKNYCAVATDCACGLDTVTNECAIENISYVISGRCTIPNFCSGVNGDCAPGCVNNQCRLVCPNNTPTQILLSGDINHDSIVNLQDYILLSNAFGTNNDGADINRDGIVNLQDYVILSNNFGKTILL